MRRDASGALDLQGFQGVAVTGCQGRDAGERGEWKDV
jgi:hypothetical protein